MKIYKIKLTLSIFIFFISCNNDDKKFIQTWESAKIIIPYKAHLKINANNTFEFKGGACQSRFYSSGKYKIINDTLILNSNDSEECRYVFGFGECITINPNINYESKTTIKGCTPETQNDYIVFNNDKFYIKSDTLKFVPEVKNCPIKNDFFKEINH